jgi:5-formyltetrahydrofolate cyclo-ligase
MQAGDAGHRSPDADTARMRAAKAALRRDALARRAARPPDDRARVARALATRAAALRDALGAGVVAAYVGVGDEPATLPALDALRDAGAAVLLPVTVGAATDPSLAWAWYEGVGRLHRARYGLLEPAGDRLPPDAIATADLVLVPALLVDRSGNRLGRGAGYYDRALAGLSTPTYAVVHDDEVVAALPTEPHDVAVSGALTPSGALSWPS